MNRQILLTLLLIILLIMPTATAVYFEELSTPLPKEVPQEILVHVTDEIHNQIQQTLQEKIPFRYKIPIIGTILKRVSPPIVPTSLINDQGVTIGETSFDSLLEKHGVIRIEPVMTKPEKNDAQTARDRKEITTQSEQIPTVLKFTLRETTESVIQDLEKHPGVRYAETNKLYYSHFIPNDPLFSQQWAHALTQATEGWDSTQGNTNVVIAIIDTGVDYSHEDLRENMMGDCQQGCPEGTGTDLVNVNEILYFLLGFRFYDEEDYHTPDNEPRDYHGHGTHVAGIAAAHTNNNIGVSGVCPECKIMPIRAGFATDHFLLGAQGVMDSASIAPAILYATDNDADIISMSFGGKSSNTVQNAIQYAHSQGVIMVAAAGNDAQDAVSYPASSFFVIAVTAVSHKDTRPPYANYGVLVNIAAPGGDNTEDTGIVSTVPQEGILGNEEGYAALQGTSMAAPYIAGVIGLMLSQDQTRTPDDIKEMLIHSIDSPAETENYIGRGRVNIQKAVTSPGPSRATAMITKPLLNEVITTDTYVVEGLALGSSYTLSKGVGLYPKEFQEVQTGTKNTLGEIGTVRFTTSGIHTLRLRVMDTEGITKEVYRRFSVEGIVEPRGEEIPADFNNDGAVDALDYALLETCFTGLLPDHDPLCGKADLTKDGSLDLEDYTLFREQITNPAFTLPALECREHSDCETNECLELNTIGGVCRIRNPEGGPTLVNIVSGYGQDHNVFISPLSENTLFDRFIIQLNEPAQFVFGSVKITNKNDFTTPEGNAFGIIKESFESKPRVSSVLHLGEGFFFVQLTERIPVQEWTHIVLGMQSTTTGIQTHIDFDIAHLPSDVNQDGTVNIKDATAFATVFAQKQKEFADINGDNEVNIKDATSFGQTFRGEGGSLQWNTAHLPERI